MQVPQAGVGLLPGAPPPTAHDATVPWTFQSVSAQVGWNPEAEKGCGRAFWKRGTVSKELFARHRFRARLFLFLLFKDLLCARACGMLFG
jgi:hypothetical protein